MKPEEVPAELVDKGREALYAHLRSLPPAAMYLPTLEERTRAVLAAVLPAAHDMWREQVINDAARILIHTNGDGITITCPPCDEVLYTGFGSVGASYVLVALLGHLAGDRHAGRQP